MHSDRAFIPSLGHSPRRRCAQHCPQSLWKTIAAREATATGAPQAARKAGREAASHIRGYGGDPAELAVVLSREVDARCGVVLACPAAVIDGD
jgi:hypothetical protein